jgi:hypothetical protein
MHARRSNEPLDHPDQATGAWLTGTLRDGGWIGDRESVEVSPVETKGKSGSWIVRLAVHPTGTLDEPLPETVVVKIGRSDTLSEDRRRRRLKEHLFYAGIAPELPAGIAPLAFSSRFDGDSGASTVVMEDLTGEYVAPPRGLPASRAELMGTVDTLAQLHAALWNDERLRTALSERPDDWAGLSGDVIRQSAGGFLASYGDRLPREVNLAIREAVDAYESLSERRPSGCITLVHGDAHPANFLRPRAGDGPAVAIDFELWDVDTGPRDVASLLVAGLEVSSRAEIEGDVIRTYVAALAREGVQGYDESRCREDYRAGVGRLLAALTAQWDPQRTPPFWSSLLCRAAAAWTEAQAARR